MRKKYIGETEEGYLWKAETDGENEYSFVLTECGANLYDPFKQAFRRDGCVCPKCGRVIAVVKSEV